jgi:hypothetical protein
MKRKAMKQKYHIRKDIKAKTLLIQEFAVLTSNTGKQKYPDIQGDDYSLLCEQSYSGREVKSASSTGKDDLILLREVKSASSTGKDDLILLLRNQHFFPIGTYMDKIADTVMGMYASKGEQHEDLIFDDKAILVGNIDEQGTVAEIKDDKGKNPAETIDTLIEDKPKKK